MAFSLLSDLDSYRTDWMVRVRVCRMWEFINHKRNDELVSLNMILIDEKETLMQALIWKNQINRFRDKLTEGSLITIKNFKVTDNNGDYKPVTSAFKIIFLRITAVQQLAEDSVRIPQHGFQFLQPDMIQSRVNNNALLSDIVGCLCGIGDIESVGLQHKKRDIRIITDIGECTVTLWEEFGEKFDPYLYKTESGPYIIIITSITIKEYRGKVSFGTTSASKIYVNLKHDDVAALIEQYSTKSVGVHTIQTTTANTLPIEEEMFLNRMSITSLLEADWPIDLEEYNVTVRAKIKDIDKYYKWYYISCNKCKKKIEQTDGVYTCPKCDTMCQFPVVRYKIHITVTDCPAIKNVETTFVMFNPVSEKLLDTSAHKLVNRLSTNGNEVPPQIQSLCGKEFIFKIRLNNYNLKEGLENFTVTKVFTPDDALEEQYNGVKDKKGKGIVDDITVNTTSDNLEDFDEDLTIGEASKQTTLLGNKGKDFVEDLSEGESIKRYGRRTPTKKASVLEKINKITTPTLFSVKDYQTDDDLPAWKRRTSSRKLIKRRNIVLDDDCIPVTKKTPKK